VTGDRIVRKVNLAIKRAADIVCSGLGLILLSPFFLICACLVKVFMPGTVFFKQQRVGINGKTFDILKFRSMKVDKEAEREHNFSKDAQRLTPFGRILRRTKMDELPQLLNVLIGEMSLVGPRPTVLEQTVLYDAYQRKRLEMRPGITGLAQVNGNIALSWDERIEYDIKYVENFSILLDIQIILKTILVIIFGEEKFIKSKKIGV